MFGSTWGQNNNNQQQSGGGLFGGGGGFGQQQQQQQPQQQNTGFGSGTGGGFGQQNTSGTSLFGGGNTNTNTGFGSGGFGSNTNTGSTAFGASRPTFGATGSSPFGATNTSNTGGGLFGSTANTGSTFGASNTSTGFGASRPSGFGGTTGGSMFGSNTGTTTGFGASSSTTPVQPNNQIHNWNPNPPPPIPATGTKEPPYQPTWQRDPPSASGAAPIPHLFHVINAMEAYRGGSFEELRLLDYSQGRKEPTAQPVAQPATSTFGQPVAGSGFGTSSTGGFGQTSSTPAFGAKPGGLFGSSTGTTGGGFGTSSTGGFGSTNTNTGGGLFGQSNTNTTSGFGAQSNTTGGGLFGQSNPQSSTGSGVFGNTNPFGQNTQQNQQQQSTGFGGFGSTANKPAFGSTPAFGSGSTGTFGQTSTTGTTGGFGGFGQQNQQQPQQQNQTGSGLFGGGGFGQNTANQQTNTGGGLFGQNNQQQQQQSGGLFGNTANKPGGLFGNTQATNTATPSTGFGGFGQNTATNTAQPTTSLFGNTNTNAANTGGSSLFGQTNQQTTQPATGGLFGNTAAANTSGSSLFGPKPAVPATGGLFGNTTSQPAQPTTGFGGFGTQNNATGQTGGGLFGGNNQATAAKPTTGLFGGGGSSLFGGQQQQQPAAQPAAGGGLFGSLNQSQANTGGSSLFGGGSTTQTMLQPQLGQSNGGMFGSTLGQSTNNNLQQSLSASVNQNPYGRSQLFQYNGQKLELGDTTKKAAMPPLTASAYRPSPSKGSRLTKLRGFASSVNGSQSSSRASSVHGSPTASLVGSPAPSERYKGLTDSVISPNAFIPRPNVKKITIASNKTLGGDENLDNILGKSTLRSEAGTPTMSPESRAPSVSLGQSNSRHQIEDTPTRRPASAQLDGSMRVAASERPLKHGDYWCRPKMDKLKTMPHDQLAHLENFVAGRKGYGEVRFLRPVDLTTIPSLHTELLGHIITVEELELCVYPDDSNKPPRGKGLNVPAEITLENVWARDKASRQPVTDPYDPRYKRQLKRIQAVPDTEFISYVDGLWTFKVDHFSRYGLTQSDSEDDDDMDQKADEGVGSPTPAGSRSPERSQSDWSEDDDFLPPTKSLYDADAISEDHDSDLDDESMSEEDSFIDVDHSIEADDEDAELEAYAAIKSKLGAQGMQRLREMQSSFFGAPGPKPKRLTPAQAKALEVRAAIDRKRVSAGFEEAEEDEEPFDDRAVKRTSFGESSSPPQLRQPRKYARVPLKDSFVAGNEGVRTDSGLSMGRSFRCSWGPNGEIVHMGKICAPNASFTPSPDAVVFVQQVDLLAEPKDVECRRADRLLKLLLDYTEVDLVDDIPEAVTNTEIRFRQFAGLFDSSDRSHEANLWRLGQALFDEIDLKLPEDTPDEVRNNVAEVRRKLALSKWLEDAVAPAMDDDLAQADDDRAAKVFALLTGNRIDRAVQSALQANDMRLATLVSQAAASDEFRAEVQRQLDDWTKYKSNALIGYQYRKIYALLAGVTDVSAGNPERGADHASDVFVAENLDWKRAFGLYLWHGCPFEVSIADVLDTYSNALQSAHPPAKPLPPYLEQSDDSNRWDMPTEPTDVLFKLMRLYSDLTVPLDETVIARDSSASPTDFRLPWHLSFLLSQALQKRDFADREDADKEGIKYSATANRLTESYAAQLEETGQWTWAAFVLLHLAYAESRRAAVMGLLFRHPEPTAMEQAFLIDKLRIPRSWLHEARAAFLASEGNAYGEFRDLVPAGLGDRAQRILVTKLAPEAVLRQDRQLLHRLCDELAPLHPDGWEFAGKLFMDYLDILKHTKPLLAAVRRAGAHPDPHEAGELRRLADSLPRVLQLLPALFPDKNNVQQVASLSHMLSTLQDLSSALHAAGYMSRPPVSDLLLAKDRLHLLQESATESFDKSLQTLVAA